MATSRANFFRGRRAGFTLIEAAITTSIIGIGFLAVMELFAASTRQNMAADHTTAALMLSAQVEEMLALLPMDDPTTGSQTYFGPEEATIAQYDDLDDFAGADKSGTLFSPPVDCRLQPINSLGQYSQRVVITRVLPDGLNLAVNAYTGACRVDIIVLFAAVPSETPYEVHRQSFVRFDE